MDLKKVLALISLFFALPVVVAAQEIKFPVAASSKSLALLLYGWHREWVFSSGKVSTLR
jgi:hypothetical protein